LVDLILLLVSQDKTPVDRLEALGKVIQSFNQVSSILQQWLEPDLKINKIWFNFQIMRLSQVLSHIKEQTQVQLLRQFLKMVQLCKIITVWIKEISKIMRFNGQSSRITSLKHQMDSSVDYLTNQEDFSNLQHQLLNLNHQSHWQKFQ